MTTPGAHEFRCPACCGALTDAELLVCTQCARRYPRRDGILDFRVENRDYYFNPVPPEEMRALIRDMAHEPWPKTVRRFVAYTQRPGDWIDNLTVDGRYAWKILLDLRRDGVLLDIGCGLGNLSYNVAPHVAKVYAMDLTYERVAFARARFQRAKNRDHVVVLAGGDGAHLPLPDGAVDYVVLSGVLEWVGDSGGEDWEGGTKLRRTWRMLRSSFGGRSPRVAQLSLLREIRRVLRPDGQLFVAIENRTSYRYFLGDADHHSGLRYSSLLPRPLANLYSIWKARYPYRTYTYSIPGHRRLLRQAGFPAVEFFGLLPGYSRMRRIVPLGDAPVSWRPARASGRDRIATNKYLVPAYGIIARRHAARRRLLDDIVDDVAARLEGELGRENVKIVDYRVSGKDKGLLAARYGRTPIFIKLPFSATATDEEAANARVLTSAKAGFAKTLRYVPHSRGAGVVVGVAYFVEDFCAGSTMSEGLAELGAASAVRLAERVLNDFNPTPGPGEPFTGELYRARVTDRLAALSSLLPDHGVAARLDRFFQDSLHGAKLTRGLEHGDFGHDNILTDGRQVTGVVDWAAASSDGIPVLDALSYVDAAQRLREPGLTLQHSIPMLAQRQWADSEERKFLERQYERWNVDPVHHGALVALYWLQHVSALAPSGLAYEASRLEHDVIGVARALLGDR